jgi:hypothetical protein
MDEKCIYNCEVCGGKKEVAKEPAKAPDCCSQPMTKAEPLPVCQVSATAEHSRMDDDFGEPCDDGRSGNV